MAGVKPWWRGVLSVAAVLGMPSLAWTAEGNVLQVHPASAVPFALLLLAIATFPLVAGHWWHLNRNKGGVALILAGPVVAYLLYLQWGTGQPGLPALIDAVEEYASFMVLLAALYVVTGGLVLEGGIQGRPLVNVGLLALGSVLANLVGTTGASMLLIRPFLRINRNRPEIRHLPIFFIFTVSNLGGLLTPLGDPPLFLGFLNGVPFEWTLGLWREWLVANGVVLSVFFVWDARAWSRETNRPPLPALEAPGHEPVRVRLRGRVNLPLLAGILAGVLLQSPSVGEAAGNWLRHFILCPDLTLAKPWGEVVMAAMAVLSLLLTPRGLRRTNHFTWGPIVEVAVVFAGIFVAMVPALELLRANGQRFGLTEAWHYFWLTGLLSAFLDNAPTYLAFATLAAGEQPMSWLVLHREEVLRAISCGAVFLGAMTYIGNGPNFMVKAISDEMGVKTPSFFGYLAYSLLILGPTFVLITVLFFRPPWW
jgi:Na+/H+ antiporter NhaD/arsenite permease-like protein